MFSYVKALWHLYFHHNLPRATGALAYFFGLTIFPVVLCLTVAVGMAHADMQPLLQALSRVLPQAATDLLQEFVDYAGQNSSPALLGAAIPAIILTASAALRVMLDTMDEIYEQPRNTSLRRLLLSIVFSLLFLITLYLSILVIFTGGWFLNWIIQMLPPQLSAMTEVVSISRLWQWLRYLLLFCFMMLLVLILYRLGTPKGQVHVPALLLSSLLSSGAMVAISVLFSWFIGLSSRYSLLYGSLASIVILLIWLYLCGTILLLGAIFMRLWSEKHPKPQ